MKINTALAAAVATASLGTAPLPSPATIRPANESAPVMICIRPEATLFWRTAMGNSLTLRWAWPEGATGASLTVAGMNTARTNEAVNRISSEGSYTLTLPAATDTLTEDAFDISIEFDTGEIWTAKLGHVRGVNGTASRLIGSSLEKEWGRIDRTAVLPVPQGTEYLSVTVDKKQTGVAWDGGIGWYGWGPVAVGKYKVGCEGTVSYLIDLERVSGGTSVLLY